MKILGISLVLIVWMIISLLASITIIGLVLVNEDDWMYIGKGLINKLTE